jgi:hypothetical protein
VHAGLVSGVPLMRPTFHIRPARVEEAVARSDLCFRSKAVWGCDAGFMALMPATLEVAPKEIAAGDVWIASVVYGQIVGVVAPRSRWPGTLDFNKLFIEPRHIPAARRQAVDDSRRPEHSGLSTSATGVVRIGEAPSDAVPGRLLPLYESGSIPLHERRPGVQNGSQPGIP